MADAATSSGLQFTRTLYRTFQHEHYATPAPADPGPYFPRGCCGGGNANGGIFVRPNGKAVPRTETTGPAGCPPRMDNLGNMAAFAPRTRRNPFGHASTDRMFEAQLTPPTQPFSTRGQQHASPGRNSPQMYALKQETMGTFGAVSRSRTPFSTWKEGQALASR